MQTSVFVQVKYLCCFANAPMGSRFEPNTIANDNRKEIVRIKLRSPGHASPTRMPDSEGATFQNTFYEIDDSNALRRKFENPGR
jgi:hypothetical protein